MRVLEGSLSLTVLGHRVLIFSQTGAWVIQCYKHVIKQKTTYLCKLSDRVQHSCVLETFLDV